MLYAKLGNNNMIEIKENIDSSWLEVPHYDSTNSSFLKLNTGLAIEKLATLKPKQIALSKDASDFEIAEAFPESFPLSGGLSRPIPRFREGKIPTNKAIVCGISSIKRQDTEYLTSTLESLFNNLSTAEKSNFAIVVLLAEENDEKYVLTRIQNIKKRFEEEIKSGLLEVLFLHNVYIGLLPFC